ncbi:MAG TPA: GAF domain-containing protein, partial [Casimicrobiaceae bacterium]
MGRGAKPAKAKVEARPPPVARKSRKIDGSTGRHLEQRLAEALEQQAATSEILHAISSSPTDLDPVFRMILVNATRLCGASVATLWLFDGEVLTSVANQNASPAFAEYLARARIRPSRETTTRRAALERKTIHVADLFSNPDYSPPEFQRKEKVKTVLSVPLLRQDTLVGVVTLWRREVRPFTDRQVALVETFADQAVIAIENVRLFKELESRNCHLTEALEQQTSTSDILRVISQSPTDVQPVFDTIAAAALKLCRGSSVNVFRYDGELVHLAAVVNVNPDGTDAARRSYPRPVGRDNAASRAVLTRGVVAIPDVLEDPEYAPKAAALTSGFRSVLSVPLIRDGNPIGAITVGLPEPGPFPDKQIALLQTFADQAVIAIENVRLFTELEARNRDLTEALEQQTATSDILRVISQSPTDVQPVFDTIAAAALKLCRASSGAVMTFDGELIHLAAVANLNPEGADAIRKVFPRPPGREMAATRAVLTCSVVAISDVLEDHEFGPRSVAVATGFRSVLAVPLVRDGSPIGAIAVGRPEPGLFPDKQVTLLQTFADQAVIAIENVRLFTELEARNSELRVALEHQTATSELLRVIGRSAFDLQPVFETLAENAARLCAARRALIFRFDGQLLRFAVGHNVSPELRAFLDQHPIAPGRGSNAGRAALERRTIHNHDVLSDPEYSYGAYKVDPYRTVLTVPMLKANELLGVVIVYRHEVRPFSDNQITLMETFADQAVIAIENVRLFNETKEALERQTATAEVLKVISESPTDVQPVFDAIAERAKTLCGA